ncbi:cyanate hydratase isoform B [Micractinium conductrix]|uniref:Cyanate hydratase isoform B n=1 Tax=Micractinium conductrix TaxID=554055 RepID=A0A2P6V3J9_9CHLO|nr:cyanate hydratase isoform B [Micractinium conductrix]|eukprot:PSC68669.1 cyanate hydratase isoform B [Micractinium conductrix]
MGQALVAALAADHARDPNPALARLVAAFLLLTPELEAAGRVMQDFEDIDRELGNDHDWSVSAFGRQGRWGAGALGLWKTTLPVLPRLRH